jgi:hypothetical protein
MQNVVISKNDLERDFAAAISLSEAPSSLGYPHNISVLIDTGKGVGGRVEPESRGRGKTGEYRAGIFEFLNF